MHHTTDPRSAGARFRERVAARRPLQIFETLNAAHAMLARQADYQAVYLAAEHVLSGAASRSESRCSQTELLCEQVSQITEACGLPILVDLATGFGTRAAHVDRTVRRLIRAGAAACHIEDPVWEGRCGYRPDSQLDCIKAAADARTDGQFYLIAQVHAGGRQGVGAALERAMQCLSAGADAILLDAFQDRGTYLCFADAVGVPVLADIRELAAIQMATPADLAVAEVAMALYRAPSVWPRSLLPSGLGSDIAIFRKPDLTEACSVHEMMN